MDKDLKRLLEILELRLETFDMVIENKNNSYEEGMSDSEQYVIDCEIDQTAHNFIEDIRLDVAQFKQSLVQSEETI